MSDVTARVQGGGGFRKALAVALAQYERPKIGIVATTPARADYIRQICVNSAKDGEILMYVEDEASDMLSKVKHEVVVLDSSLPTAMRSGLTQIAREQLKGCTVIQIRKWSVEPPT